LIEGRHGSAPVYPFPDDAARALGHAWRRQKWLRQSPGQIEHFPDARPDEAAMAIADSLAEGGGWMRPDAVARLLDAYGLHSIESRVVETVAEAVDAAASLGFPVALKADATGVVHKTEAGAVALGLADPADLEAAAREMSARLDAHGHPVERFVVQRMAGDGVEMLVGVVHDPSFGPIAVCGAGGVTAEMVRDISARITPLTDVDAEQMVRELRISRLLLGWRGSPPVDLDALKVLLLRVSALVDAHAEIRELDLNPVVVNATGVSVVDARVSVAASQPRPSWPAIGAAAPL
jgi:acyl-CoA synthetase (NDP forming)